MHDVMMFSGERNQKYKELKKREEAMNEFMDAFDETRKHETERMAQLEQNTTLILEHMSRVSAKTNILKIETYGSPFIPRVLNF